MPNTTRLKWPYPTQNKNNWYDAFEDLVNAQDASAYAALQARDLVLTKGGTMTWSASTGVLEWAEAIEIPSSLTGFKWSLSSGSVVLAEGVFGYTGLTARPLANQAIALSVGGTVPTVDDSVVLFFRKDDRVYFRGGQVIKDGESKVVLADGASGGAGGLPAMPEATVLVGDASGDGQAVALTGDVGINAAGLTSLVDGAVTTLKLVDGAVTNAKIADGIIKGTKVDTGTPFDWSANPENLLTGSASLPSEVVNLDTVSKQTRRTQLIVGFKQTSGLVPLLLTKNLLVFEGALYSGLTPTPVINLVYVLNRSGGAHSVGAYLYNVSDGEIVTSSVVSGVTAGLPEVSRVALNLGGGANQMKAAESIYEVRLTTTGTTAPELADLGGAYLEFIF